MLDPIEENRTITVTAGTKSGKANAVVKEVTNKKNPISFTKTDTAGKLLKGATFGLYSVSANSTDPTAVSVNGLYETCVATATSGESGVVGFASVTNGTYRLKEITAPTGYEKTENVFIIIVENGGMTSMYLEGDATKTEVKTVVNQLKKTNTGDGKDDPKDDPKDKKTTELQDSRPKDKKTPTDSNSNDNSNGSQNTRTALPTTSKEARLIYVFVGAIFILGGYFFFRRYKKLFIEKSKE